MTLDSVLDAFEDAAALVGPDTEIVVANRAWRVHGFTEPVFADGDPLPVVRVVQGEIPSFTAVGRRRSADGWRWFRSHVRPITGTPGVVAVITHRDITDERRLTLHMSRSPVAHLELGPDGSLLTVNERWEELRGRPLGAELGSRWLRDTPEDERNHLLGRLSVPEAFQTSLTTVGRDDRRCELAMAFEPTFDGSEWIGWHASATDRTELSELEEMASSAVLDPLTGLANRSTFQAALARTLARRGDRPAAVLFADLDGFKEVNDEGGHATGDEVLRKVATRVQKVLRPADLVARYGGDEFVVLLEDVEPGYASEIGERLVAAFREPIGHGGGQAQIGISVGVTSSRPDDDVDSIIVRADRAMYVAKEAGGMQVAETGIED